MTRKTDGSHRIDSNAITGEWTRTIVSGFRAWRERRLKQQVIQSLIAQDERILDDIGLSRMKLVGDLGHDPCAFPGFFNAGTFLHPNFRNEFGISGNHIGECR